MQNHFLVKKSKQGLFNHMILLFIINFSFFHRKSVINSNVPFWYRNYRRNTNKLRATKKVDLMETVTDKQSEYTIALSHLRDREYAHLQKLIHSNSIEHILEPFSAI